MRRRQRERFPTQPVGTNLVQILERIPTSANQTLNRHKTSHQMVSKKERTIVPLDRRCANINAAVY